MDSDITLGETGPPHRRLTATLCEYGGSRLLDLRVWYLEKKTKEYRRTRKGLSLTRDNFQFLHELFSGKFEQIASWLDVSYVPEEAAIKRERDEAALLRSERQLGDIRHRIFAGHKGAPFAHVSGQGGETVVDFNATHPFISTGLCSSDSDSRCRDRERFLAVLLAGFSRACESLSDASAVKADALFEALLEEWSAILSGLDLVGEDEGGHGE